MLDLLDHLLASGQLTFGRHAMTTTCSLSFKIFLNPLVPGHSYFGVYLLKFAGKVCPLTIPTGLRGLFFQTRTIKCLQNK
jgi:hypothetical protein